MGFSWGLRGKSGAWCGGLFDEALHSLRIHVGPLVYSISGLVVEFRGLVSVCLGGGFVVGFR